MKILVLEIEDLLPFLNFLIDRPSFDFLGQK